MQPLQFQTINRAALSYEIERALEIVSRDARHANDTGSDFHFTDSEIAAWSDHGSMAPLAMMSRTAQWKRGEHAWISPERWSAHAKRELESAESRAANREAYDWLEMDSDSKTYDESWRRHRFSEIDREWFARHAAIPLPERARDFREAHPLAWRNLAARELRDALRFHGFACHSNGSLWSAWAWGGRGDTVRARMHRQADTLAITLCTLYGIRSAGARYAARMQAAMHGQG